MKKRIGTKLYDTETSEYIANVGIGDIYRKRTRGREWFFATSDIIEPVSEKQARALLGENVYIEKPVDLSRIMIAIHRDTHDKITKLAEKDGVKLADEVDKIVEGYLLNCPWN